MKLKTISLAIAVSAIVACTDTSVYMPESHDPNSTIEFNNFVDGMTRTTRASKHTGSSSFVLGDAMGVWGFQTTGEYIDIIFNNQRVYYVDGSTWTYTNKKLWNVGSSYVFYGFFPYDDTIYELGDDDNHYITIDEYTIPAVIDDQKDLMISEKRAVSPFNTVDMIFHHILSNVNVLARISPDMETDEIKSITLKKFSLKGAKSTGKYTQNAWHGNVAAGDWSAQSGVLDLADVTDVTLNMDKSLTSVIDDCLMIPQMLYSSDEGVAHDITVDVVFRIAYKDGTASTFTKNGLRLAGVTGSGNNGASGKESVISSWKPNYRYNYILTFNPNRSTRIWDADGDGNNRPDPETETIIHDDVDDTPTPGTMRYNPDQPNVIQVLEDTDGDNIPDTWIEYPILWEDIDGDGLLEAGIDKDGDGHIDNLDGENDSSQGGDPHKDPSDSSSNNPEGKDAILVFCDQDGDGEYEWIQLEKDPDTGVITPKKETESATIEFTATVSEWDDAYKINYDINPIK